VYRQVMAILAVALLLSSCRRAEPPPPILVRYAGVNDDTEEIINERLRSLPKYSFTPGGAKILEKGGRSYQFQRLPNPGYKGADDVLTLALSTHTSTSRPTGALFFVDLYWFKTFCPEWLVPFAEEKWQVEQFKEDFIKICYLGDGSKRRLYAIPFSAKGNVLFYRRDLLKLLGEKPPGTWDELASQVKRLSEMAEKEPALAKVQFGLIFHGSHLANDFYPIMWGYGGDIFAADKAKQEAAVEALYRLKQMVHDSGAGKIRLCPSVDVLRRGVRQGGDRLHRCFARGEAVFMINWDNRLDKMRKYAEATVASQQIGVAPIPSRPGQTSASNIGSWGWVVSRRPSREDAWTTGEEVLAAIKEFVNDLTSVEAQEWLAANHGYIPSRNIVLSEKAEKKIAELGPGATDAIELFADPKRLRFIDRPHNKRVNDIVEQALRDALESPLRDADAERQALRELLDDVRRRAQVFLSE